MVEFPTEEKEGALKKNDPVYGYAHPQFGLETRPESHEGGTQLFHGVEYDALVFMGREQYLSVTPDSIHIGLSTNLQS